MHDTSSKNAIEYGSRSQTLILPGEREESWLLLDRWLRTYQPEEDSLQYDFVLKTAQAEWFRIRAHRNLESHLASTHGFSHFNWTDGQIKKHDLLLRYKTIAERSFQREFRTLEQFCKIHHPPPAKESSAKKSAAPNPSLSPNPRSSSSEKIPPAPPASSWLCRTSAASKPGP